MRKLKSPHDYEVIRGIVIDILLGKETIKYGIGNFHYLSDGVAQVMLRRNEPFEEMSLISGDVRMDDRDVELVRDVFWDLFRQGLITLGSNASNDGWPNFRLSHHAAETLCKASPYRFHNSTSYINLVKAEAPDISSDTEEYLDEAVATYYAECLLASSVMLGVAAEIEFGRLIDAGLANTVYSALFLPASKEQNIRQRILKFQSAFPSLPKDLRRQVGEDFEMHANAIQSVLRVARNNVGHGLAKRSISREHMYVNLQMFVPFAGHVERLRKAL
jgi:hypothetical protein